MITSGFEPFSRFYWALIAMISVTMFVMPYVQVFDDKHGFIPNLSILDLICNEGPNAMMYLEAQDLKL